MTEQDAIKKVLVTGAYGLIGNLVYAHLAGKPQCYEVYGMTRRIRPSQRAEQMEYCAIPEEKLRIADLTDFESMQQAVKGMDMVVHMAADPSGFPGWDSVLNNNIIGSYHMFEACRLAGVKRIVYASSNQVVFGYRDTEPYQSLLSEKQPEINPQDIKPIVHSQPTRPINLYACSKVFGEGVAHMYAHTHDMSCIVLRIGWVLSDDTPPGHFARSVWCSQRDCVQMVELALNAPDHLRFDVFFVQSENAYNFVDIQHAKDVLGYVPKDHLD